MALNEPSRSEVVVQERGLDAWERLCYPTQGCKTACCFYADSPCEHLILDPATQVGRCAIYDHRFGEHQTVDGQRFQCVPMSVKLRIEGAPHLQCGYAVIRSVEGVPIVRGLA